MKYENGDIIKISPNGRPLIIDWRSKNGNIRATYIRGWNITRRFCEHEIYEVIRNPLEKLDIYWKNKVTNSISTKIAARKLNIPIELVQYRVNELITEKKISIWVSPPPNSITTHILQPAFYSSKFGE